MRLVQRQMAKQEECAAALRMLTEKDLRRLDESGRLRATGLVAAWKDATCATRRSRGCSKESGTGRWKCRWTFFCSRRCGASRASIGGARSRRPWSRSLSCARTAEVGDGLIATAGDASMAPEARTTAAETLARIEALFSDDADAQAVMAGKAAGLSRRRKSRRSTAMDETRYATTLRRIRRGVIGLAGEGGEQA